MPLIYSKTHKLVLPLVQLPCIGKDIQQFIDNSTKELLPY